MAYKIILLYQVLEALFSKCTQLVQIFSLSPKTKVDFLFFNSEIHFDESLLFGNSI